MATMSAADLVPAERWAIVEILGRRKLAGRIKEERRYGAEGITVEVPRGRLIPVLGEAPVPAFLPPIFHPGAALYAVSEVSEAQAREAARSYEVDQTLELLGYEPLGDDNRVLSLTEKGRQYLKELEQEKLQQDEEEEDEEPTGPVRAALTPAPEAAEALETVAKEKTT